MESRLNFGLALAATVLATSVYGAPDDAIQHLERLKQLSSPTTYSFGSITCTEPPVDYPGADGYVVVRVTFGTSGTVENAQVSQSSGNPTVDAAALKAATSIKCDPYIPSQTGKAVPVVANKPYRFEGKPSRPVGSAGPSAIPQQ